jgi:aminopeptidase N
MYRPTPPVIHLKDYRPPEFLIDQVDLRFDLGWTRPPCRPS